MMQDFLKRFIKRQDRWSIGIYTGDSPYHLNAPKGLKNPVLTAKDVTDRRADFVADPFMIHEESVWYMFFEVFNRVTQRGEIGFAVSDDGFRWTYRQIVLAEPFHVSYPYVLKGENEFYMIPESQEKKAIRLYKAVRFPDQWQFAADLLTGDDFVDSSIFYFKNKWWLFTCPAVRHDVLKLFYADEIRGPWHAHPKNPLIEKDPHRARCGGRVLVWGERVIRYAQDDYPVYGNRLRAFEIIRITTTDYEEKECPGSPVLKPKGIGWNRSGMHTADPHVLAQGQWIACVDGNARYIRLR